MESETFAYHVLQSEGFTDWKVKFSTGGSICLTKAKEIILDEDHQIFGWRSRLAIIHEIAHIRTWPQDMQHSRLYFTEYANLVLKYLGVSDEKIQQMVRER